MTSRSPADLFDLAAGGDRRALGRLLSLTEALGPESAEIAERAHPLQSGAHVIGITGAPGAGKSTLVGQLVAAVAEAGAKPAVLAVDPSSPLTGGAILGDRVRMADVETAFVRSVATRGHAGGLALSIPASVRLFDSMGYDPIIIETVGVGQVEVDVTAAADTTIVVVTPGMGDAVQANKAGLLEVADIFVVNKADQPGAADTRRDLELMLELSHVTGQEDAGYRPPILMVNSLDGDGISLVQTALNDHLGYLRDSGQLAQRRRLRGRFEIENRLRATLETRIEACLGTDQAGELLDRVGTAELTPLTAAELLAADAFGPSPFDT